jgi:hypothetical protein
VTVLKERSVNYATNGGFVLPITATFLISTSVLAEAIFGCAEMQLWELVFLAYLLVIGTKHTAWIMTVLIVSKRGVSYED